MISAKYLTDYHSHTTRCRHARGTMAEYVEQALAIGLTEFGFSEHSPWMIQQRGRRAMMLREEMDGYIAEARELRELHERGGARPFRLRLGLEMDFVPSRLEEARATAAKHDWDYLIGSVHHLGFWCLPDQGYRAHYDMTPIEDLCDLYFEITRHMVRERFCDVIAHLDVVKKFGHGTGEGMLPWVEPLIPEIRAAGMVVEINTSGMDHEAGETYPGWSVIEALHAGGVGLMLCSDSHAPEHVGRHFEPVLAGLRKRGITRLTRFEQREAIEYAFDA